MPSTLVKETLTVAAISTQFGNGAIGVATGQKEMFKGKEREKLEFISFNDGVGIPVKSLSVGETYEFELAISDKGKRYVNAIPSLSNGEQQHHVSNVTATDNVKTTFKKSGGGIGSSVDWAAKDRAMAAGGILHDAAALVAPTIVEGMTAASVASKVEDIALELVSTKHRLENALKSK